MSSIKYVSKAIVQLLVCSSLRLSVYPCSSGSGDGGGGGSSVSVALILLLILLLEDLLLVCLWVPSPACSSIYARVFDFVSASIHCCGALTAQQLR